MSEVLFDLDADRFDLRPLPQVWFGHVNQTVKDTDSRYASERAGDGGVGTGAQQVRLNQVNPLASNQSEDLQQIPTGEGASGTADMRLDTPPGQVLLNPSTRNSPPLNPSNRYGLRATRAGRVDHVENRLHFDVREPELGSGSESPRPGVPG